MILATTYYAMVLTNWGDPVFDNEENQKYFSANWTSYWVQFASQWFCALIYILSLLGPVMCSGRNWGEN